MISGFWSPELGNTKWSSVIKLTQCGGYLTIDTATLANQRKLDGQEWKGRKNTVSGAILFPLHSQLTGSHEPATRLLSNAAQPADLLSPAARGKEVKEPALFCHSKFPRGWLHGEPS